MAQVTFDGVRSMEVVGVPLSHPLTGWDEPALRHVTPGMVLLFSESLGQSIPLPSASTFSPFPCPVKPIFRVFPRSTAEAAPEWGPVYGNDAYLLRWDWGWCQGVEYHRT